MHVPGYFPASSLARTVGRAGSSGQSRYSCPFMSSEAHIPGRKRDPSPSNWSPGIAKLADITFLVTRFFQNCINIEKNLSFVFTKRMNNPFAFPTKNNHWVHRLVKKCFSFLVRRESLMILLQLL